MCHIYSFHYRKPAPTCDWGWLTTRQLLHPARTAKWPERSGPPCRLSLPPTPKTSSARWSKMRRLQLWRRVPTSASLLAGWGRAEVSWEPCDSNTDMAALSKVYHLPQVSVSPSGDGCGVVQGSVRKPEIWLPALPRCLLPRCAQTEEGTESGHQQRTSESPLVFPLPVLQVRCGQICGYICIREAGEWGAESTLVFHSIDAIRPWNSSTAVMPFINV